MLAGLHPEGRNPTSEQKIARIPALDEEGVAETTCDEMTHFLLLSLLGERRERKIRSEVETRTNGSALGVQPGPIHHKSCNEIQENFMCSDGWMQHVMQSLKCYQFLSLPLANLKLPT